MTEKPLAIQYDPATDVVTIEGIRYAAFLFRALGTRFGEGEIFQIVRRKNGVLTLTRLQEASVAP